MWDLEAFITTTMFGGGLAGAGVTRGGATGIHGMATAVIPIGVIQVFTPIADPTTTDMMVTTATVGITDFLWCSLQMVVVAHSLMVDSLRVQCGPQLQDRVEI